MRTGKVEWRMLKMECEDGEDGVEDVEDGV